LKTVNNVGSQQNKTEGIEKPTDTARQPNTPHNENTNQNEGQQYNCVA